MISFAGLYGRRAGAHNDGGNVCGEGRVSDAAPGEADHRYIVRLEGVEYRFGGDVALAAIDLAVGEGERLAVLGPNGGGKTTLLGLLLGLRPPSRGRVVWRRAAASLNDP